MNRAAELVDELQVLADRGWRELEGGPTADWVADQYGITRRGLFRALRRRGVSWSAVKESCRQRNIGHCAGASAA